MTRVLLLVFIFLSLSQIGQAQLEENSIVLFAKANVLLESGRYDEAVRMYNRILSSDENHTNACLLYTSPSPRDATLSRMPSSA